MTTLICLVLAAIAQSTDLGPGRTLGKEEGWARDVVFPDARTIVVADWDSNAQVSVDGGATWSEHSMGATVQCLTIDPRGGLWGLYRWHGIHEASTAALVHSMDSGRTWSTIELDPRVCMPEDFVTAPGEETMLVTASGELWKHAVGGEETFERWSKLGAPNAARAARHAVAVGQTVYVAPSGELSKDGGAKWIPTTLDGKLVALARAVDAEGKPIERVFACTEDGVVHQVELAKQNWKRVSTLAPGEEERAPRVFHAACGRDGLYVCGEDGAKALGARVEPDGKVVKLDGLASNQSLRLRLAPDGAMWVVGHGVYRAEPKAKRWTRVWPK